MHSRMINDFIKDQERPENKINTVPRKKECERFGIILSVIFGYKMFSDPNQNVKVLTNKTGFI